MNRDASGLGGGPHSTSEERLVTGAHSAHFLTRLDRLPPAQVELALALYRDHELVKSLLEALEVGDSVERVAISLADAQRGPFVLVTRAGQFVTCLGEGMRVSDLPVVTKERFDRVTRDVQRIRELKAEILRHPQREVERAMARLCTGGTQLSREEFLAVAAWQPVLAPKLMEGFLRITTRLWSNQEQLILRQHHFKYRDEKALELFWMDAWALMHLGLLLGIDGGRYLRPIWDFAVGGPEMAAILGETLRLWVLPYTARRAWLAAKIGKPLLAFSKQLYRAPGFTSRFLDGGILLSSIGHGHQKYQAEIGKLLAPVEGVLDDDNSQRNRSMQGVFSKCFAFGIKFADANFPLLLEVASEQVGALASELSPEACVAHFLQQPLPMIRDDFCDIAKFLHFLPSLVRVEAADFYLPKRELKLVSTPWSVERSIALIEPSRQRFWKERAHLPAKPMPPRPPGRNDPCPCKSGKKYKRCCANTA